MAAVDADRNRIAARRLSDGARAIFDGDYVRAHITHGYAVTVHAAQAVTADTSHAVLGENTSRAALYVAMTPGRAAFTQEWCEAIVSVDRQPPLDVLGPPLSITAELDRWRDVASAAGNNELVKHFGSMHDDVPPRTGVPTLVHGDLKPANMLWRDGELVSLLDWEMSFNGDPAWDLGYMLIFLPGDLHPQIPGNCDLCGMWGGDQLIAAWEEGTGRSVAHCLWFEAASHAKVASLIAYGYHLVASGKSSDERLWAWGPYVTHLLELTGTMCRALASTLSARG